MSKLSTPTHLLLQYPNGQTSVSGHLVQTWYACERCIEILPRFSLPNFYKPLCKPFRSPKGLNKIVHKTLVWHSHSSRSAFFWNLLSVQSGVYRRLTISRPSAEVLTFCRHANDPTPYSPPFALSCSAKASNSRLPQHTEWARQRAETF